MGPSEDEQRAASSARSTFDLKLRELARAARRRAFLDVLSARPQATVGDLLDLVDEEGVSATDDADLDLAELGIPYTLGGLLDQLALGGDCPRDHAPEQARSVRLADLEVSDA